MNRSVQVLQFIMFSIYVGTEVILDKNLNFTSYVKTVRSRYYNI